MPGAFMCIGMPCGSIAVRKKLTLCEHFSAQLQPPIPYFWEPHFRWVGRLFRCTSVSRCMIFELKTQCCSEEQPFSPCSLCCFTCSNACMGGLLQGNAMDDETDIKLGFSCGAGPPLPPPPALL